MANHTFGKKPERSKMTLPRNSDPVIRWLFARMAEDRITYEELEDRSSIKRNTIKSWRTKSCGQYVNLEACIGSLGYRLVPVPLESELPKSLVAEVRELADKLSLTMPRTLEILTEILARGPGFAQPPAHADHPEMLLAA